MRKLVLLASMFIWVSITGPALSQLKGNITGLQIPRFVSLKSKRVNLRVGPGRKYSVQWLYVNPGLPVEIIQEFDQWRQIRDSEGTEGWVFHSLLSGKRMAIITPWDKPSSDGKANFTKAYVSNSSDASVAANLQPGLIVKIKSCNDGWCKITKDNFEGFMPKPKIWGVYPKEVFKD